MARFDLWPKPYRLQNFAGRVMRLSEDLRRTVIFVGVGSSQDFQCLGTAFLLTYKRIRYLVTAEHVARALADIPFGFRVNHQGGSAVVVHYDPMNDGARFPWHSLPDENGRAIDVAVMQFNIDLTAKGCDIRTIPETMILDEDRRASEQIGVGDLCYAIGLFRLHSGRARNLPIVHSGNIALMPGEEDIPVTNWRDVGSKQPQMVDGYLVEMLSLEGLSGSPVFVRPTVDLVSEPTEHTEWAHRRPLLLGVWQGAWAGDPATDIRETRGQKVPVGVGVVTPASKLLQLLESAPVVAERESLIARIAAENAAKPD